MASNQGVAGSNPAGRTNLLLKYCHKIMNILQRSFLAGLVGAALSAIYAFFRVGSNETYIGIISGLAILTGFVLTATSTLVILHLTSKKSNLSNSTFFAFLFAAIVLLFVIAQMWF